MKQYLEILEEILDKGIWKEPARERMPKTIDRFSIEKRFDLTKGFPLLTTKKMYWKGILHEIIWMLKGDTNIKYLVDNGVNIWTDNGYKYYLKLCSEQGILRRATYEQFIEAIKNNIQWKNIKEPECPKDYKPGDLGCIYGKEWRDWTNPIEQCEVENSDNTSFGYNNIDQVQKVINSLKENPYSRYHLVTAWNPSEMFQSAQPNCHIMFQFNCREMTLKERADYAKNNNVFPYNQGAQVEKWLDEDNIPKYYLDCKMVQRSCDTFLGVPFNIGQYAFLTHIIAKLVNMVPGELIWSGNSVHIYENHIEQVKEQLKRKPMELCQLKINADWESIDDIKFEDFEILNYKSHPAIKGELSVGL